MWIVGLILLILLILVIVLPFKSQSETIQARIRFLSKLASLCKHKSD